MIVNRGNGLLSSPHFPVQTMFLRLAVAASPVAVLPDHILSSFVHPNIKIPSFSESSLTVSRTRVTRTAPLMLSSPARSSQPIKFVWFPSSEERRIRPNGDVLHPLVVQLDRSIGLMEQQLARLGLRQEWLPMNCSFFFALGGQMLRKRLLPPSTDLNDFVMRESEISASFLEEHSSELKAAGMFPKSELQGQMLAAACVHSVTIVHWSAASEGLVETIYSPPQDVASRCRIYICSIGPVLWSTIPLGPGEERVRCDGIEGLVSESRISDEITQRLLRAQALSTAVRWISVHRALHAPTLENPGTIPGVMFNGWNGHASHQNNEMPLLQRGSADISLQSSSSGQPRLAAGGHLEQPSQGPPPPQPASPASRSKAKTPRAPSAARSGAKSAPPQTEQSHGDENEDGADGTGEGAASTRSYVLIDMSGLIFRAYHAIPRMTRQDGVVNNAVFGFCKMVQKILQSVPPESVVVPVFDKGSHTFRNDLYVDYKANRPALPDDLIPQFSMVREATEAFGLKVIEVEGFEADDIIATYATQAAAAGATVKIVSNDKDLCQLVNPQVKLWDPVKDVDIGPEEVMTKFGVPPDKVADVQALIGDSSDNVPGVKGIGAKTAALLINQFGTFKNLLESRDSIKQARHRQLLTEHEAMACLSYELVQLRTDVDVPPLSTFRHPKYDPARLRALYVSHGFKSLIADLDRPSARGGASRTRSAKAATADAIMDAAATAAVGSVGNSLDMAKVEASGGGEYKLVKTGDELQSWIRSARREGKLSIVVLGSKSDAHAADMVGIGIAVAPGEACYIPVSCGGGDGDRLGVQDVVEALRETLEAGDVIKIGHDMKYVHSLIARYGEVCMEPVDDIMLQSFVLDAGKHPHTLPDIAMRELGMTPLTLKDVAENAQNKTMRGQPSLELMEPHVVRDFAAQAADLTLRLHERLSERVVVERMSSVFHHIERPLVQVLARMEQRGVHVDSAKLTNLSLDFATRIVSLEKEVFALAKREFSIGSPKQLAQVLFEELKLPVAGKKGKTGALSTDSEVLDGLAAKGYVIADKINEWRQVSKLKSTFTDGLLSQINPRTGRVHTCFCMAAAATGRLSSVDPNLQNIPTVGLGKPLREAFTAAAGYTLMSADYSQIELRLLAHMADIDTLQEAFRNGVDVHSLTASQVFGVPLDKMTSDIRRKAKAINFGIIYGQSAFGLAKGLGIPVADAQSYIETYFERYPGIQDYMTTTREAARKQGYVETLFGRRCHIVNVASQKSSLRSYADRQAINAPIQGTAADIIKRAMVRMEPALKEAGLGARMLLQVHDELVFEVPVGEEEATTKVVKHIMEHAAEPTHRLSVPLIVDTGTGESWGDAH